MSLAVFVKAKAYMTDAAGFRFVVTTPAQPANEDDTKAIRTHATRAGVAGRQRLQPRSWISRGREIGTHTTAQEATISNHVPAISSPKRVGGAFSGLQLPSGVEPYMIRDLVKCIHSPLPTPIHFPLNRLAGVISQNMTEKIPSNQSPNSWGISLRDLLERSCCGERVVPLHDQ